MAQPRYDAAADYYITHFTSGDDPVSLSLLTMLEPLSGLRVLDVACGHGRATRELARRGGDVTGVDISGNLIKKAQEIEQHESLGIRYLHADITSPGVLGAAAFDAVACNYGLSDIDDLDHAIAAVSAALRPGGRFVFSILHPCFPGGKDNAGSWPATGSYYDEERWTPQDSRSELRRRVGANHRILSTYLNTLHRHNLWLDHIAEPAPAPEWNPEHDVDRNPVQLVVRTVKVENFTPA